MLALLQVSGGVQGISSDFRRFTKAEIRRIVPFLGLESIPFRYGINSPPEEALCLLLRCLAFHIRLVDLQNEFGHSFGLCSSVLQDVALHLYKRWKDGLFWDSRRLTLGQLETFADAIEAVGGGSMILMVLLSKFAAQGRTKGSGTLDTSVITSTQSRQLSPPMASSQVSPGHLWAG